MRAANGYGNTWAFHPMRVHQECGLRRCWTQMDRTAPLLRQYRVGDDRRVSKGLRRICIQTHSDEMQAFPAEFLLFLDADIELVLEVEGNGARRISARSEGNVFVVSDGTNETRWKLFEAQVKVESAEARTDATHIQAREQVPLAWAVPLGGREQAGRFWAFFPTETYSLTSGILNAPWKLNSDRTNLIRGPWNEAIMEWAAELIAQVLPELPTSDDQGAAVNAFPRQPERQDDIAVPLVRALWDRIVARKVLPSADATVHRPSDLTRHFIEDSAICTSWGGLANASEKRRYLHPHCYLLKTRISRLNALDAEAKRRDVKALSKASAKEWLDCIGSTNLKKAKKALMFVGGLLEKQYQHRVPQYSGSAPHSDQGWRPSASFKGDTCSWRDCSCWLRGCRGDDRLRPDVPGDTG